MSRNNRVNPDYLFAKVDYARICIDRREFDKIPQIFNGKYDLKILYPERDRFHVQEAAAMHITMGLYFAEIGKSETAMIYLNSLEKIAPEHPMLMKLRLLLMPTMLKNGISDGKFRDVDFKRISEETSDHI